MDWIYIGIQNFTLKYPLQFIYYFSPIDFTIPSWETNVILDTLICIELPVGTWGKIDSRSSLAQEGVIVIGGIIDEDYRGTLKILFFNLSRKNKTIKPSSTAHYLTVCKA